MKKRILSLLLCLALCLPLIPMTGLAAGGDGSSEANAVVVTNYAGFQAAMESTTVRYVKISGDFSDIIRHPAGGLYMGATVTGRKTLIVNGNAVFTAAAGNEYGEVCSLIQTLDNADLTIKGTGSLRFRASSYNGFNAVVRMDGGIVRVQDSVTLAGDYNVVTYSTAITNLGGSLYLYGGTLTSDTRYYDNAAYLGTLRLEGGSAKLDGDVNIQGFYKGTAASGEQPEKLVGLSIGSGCSAQLINGSVTPVANAGSNVSISAGTGTVLDYVDGDSAVYDAVTGSKVNAMAANLRGSVTIGPLQRNVYSIHVTGEGNPAAAYDGVRITSQGAGLSVFLETALECGGKLFDHWECTDYALNILNAGSSCGAYFVMPESNVTLQPVYRSVAANTYTVLANSLNVRAQPNDAAARAGGLYRGDEVVIKELDSTGTWGKITLNGTTGWVQLAYLEAVRITPAKPAGVTVQSSAGGLKISWTKDPNATASQVYRKNASGAWDKIATGTGTSFTDKGVVSGKSYTYKVRSYTKFVDGTTLTSGCCSPVNQTFIGRPTLSKAAAVSGGVRLEWTKVSGVTGYQVYRSENGSSYTRIKATVGAAYTDTTAMAGHTYSYKVRGYVKVNGAIVPGACSPVKNITIPIVLSTPALKVENTNPPSVYDGSIAYYGLKVSWDAYIAGTDMEIYRKADGSNAWLYTGAYRPLEVSNSPYYGSTCCLDELDEIDDIYENWGELFSYKIRRRYTDAAGNITYSAFSPVVSQVFLFSPDLQKPTVSSNGVKLTWSAGRGGQGYQLFRSENGGAYTRIKTTTGTSYTDTAAKPGHTYSYKVRTYRTVNGVTYTSTCRNVQKVTVTAGPAAPTGLKVQNAKGLKVTFTKAANATGTQVFRKNASGTWERVKTVVGTSWVDTDVVSGKSYTYRARSYYTDANGKNTYSAYTSAVSGTYLARPTLSKTAVSGGVKLSWTKAAGASGYQVFRSENGGTYTRIKTTTALTCTDTTCAAGKKYSYKVRAYKTVSGTNVYSICSNIVTK